MSSVKVYVLIGLSLLASGAPAEVLVRISEEEAAHQVVEIDGEIWVATDSGAYLHRDNRLRSTIENNPPGVILIAEVKQKIWLGTRKGLFEIEGGRARRVFAQSITERHTVKQICTRHEIVWIGTDRGLFRVSDGAIETLLSDQLIHALIEIEGEVWAGSNKNAYRLKESASPIPLFDEETSVFRITRAGSYLWFLTNRTEFRYGPAYRLRGGELEAFPPDEKAHIVDVSMVNGETWFATPYGVFHGVGSELRSIDEDPKEAVNTIAPSTDGQIWLGVSRGAYRYSSSDPSALIPKEAYRLDIKGIEEIADQIWMWGRRGAYRLDPEVELELRPKAVDFFGHSVLFGRVLSFAAGYQKNGTRDPYAGAIDGKFEVAARTDAFTDPVPDEAYIRFQSLRLETRYGLRKVHYQMRDAFGNTAGPFSTTVLVVPDTSMLILLALIVGASALAVSYWRRRYIASKYDNLTGVLARSHAEEDILGQFNEHLSKDMVVGAIFLDIDHFKKINDTYGHGAGDHVLSIVGETLLQWVRQKPDKSAGIRHKDIVCRWGGEEFLILMPGARKEIVEKRAEDIRKSIERLEIALGPSGKVVRITVSLGVTVCAGVTEIWKDFIARADRAVYQAKKMGRNQVVTLMAAQDTKTF